MSTIETLREKPLLTIAGVAPGPRTLAYLATPYTMFERGIDHAFAEACRLAGTLILAGVDVYSPIAHLHAIASHSEIDPHERSLWQRHNETMMRFCSTLIIGALKGWQQSEGVNSEIAAFLRARKPIFQLDPASMVMRRLIAPAGQS